MAEAEKFLFGVVSINYELTIVYVITPTQKKKKKRKKKKGEFISLSFICK